jgi:hypothetical protein
LKEISSFISSLFSSNVFGFALSSSSSQDEKTRIVRSKLINLEIVSKSVEMLVAPDTVHVHVVSNAQILQRSSNVELLFGNVDSVNCSSAVAQRLDPDLPFGEGFLVAL